MKPCRCVTRFSLMALALASAFTAQVTAQNPESSYYTYDHTITWFFMFSDVHTGTLGEQDTTYLHWAVNDLHNACEPMLMVVCGDLTENGLTGPYYEEWDQYRQTIDADNQDPNCYLDMPGNHDAYWDGANLSYYLAYSVQGSATGFRQSALRKNLAYGSYNFVTVATCQNVDAPWPFDFTGLDEEELAFLEQNLDSNLDCDLTFVFGHHPVNNFTYGDPEFMYDLSTYNVSIYGYGDTHHCEDFWIEETLHSNIASIGKSEADHVAIFGIDGNGLSYKTINYQQTPWIMITAPLDDNLGSTGGNPYTYVVPRSCELNPVRALAFALPPGTVSTVHFRIDGGSWTTMNQVPSYGANLWEGFFDGANYEYGSHTCEAIVSDGSVTNSNLITFRIGETQCTDGLDNDGDGAVDLEDCGCADKLDDNESDCTNPTPPPSVTATFLPTQAPTITPTKIATLTPTLTVTPTAASPLTETASPTFTVTASPTRSPDSCEEFDEYEPNDSYSEARLISTDAVPQRHYFCVLNDQDWAWFVGAAQHTYQIRTLNLSNCDTILQLYGADAVTLLAEDDNSGGGYDSLISYTVETSKLFYALVSDNAAATGVSVYYDVQVRALSPTPGPTAPSSATPTSTWTPVSTPSPHETTTPVVASPTPLGTPLCLHTGDVDANAVISAGDAQAAFSIALGVMTPTYAQACAADCDANGVVSAGDAQQIFGAALGIGSCADPMTLGAHPGTLTVDPGEFHHW